MLETVLEDRASHVVVNNTSELKNLLYTHTLWLQCELKIT